MTQAKRILDGIRVVAAASMILVPAAAAVISLYFAFQGSDVVIISPISSANPLVTLFLAHFFLERLERVTRLILSGTVLTVLGVVLVVVGSTL
ncbi:EamA family transporter [Candidatus Sumerlaeota bacterium]|nr:EamA family transporter [Candidatus Sumerlaeota bacterium]